MATATRNDVTIDFNECTDFCEFRFPSEQKMVRNTVMNSTVIWSEDRLQGAC